jgi:hypothetical protein
VDETLSANRRDGLYPSNLLKGAAVYKSSGQDAVGLVLLFPQLADGLMRLLLGCAKDLVDLKFRSRRVRLRERVLIRITTDMNTIPETTSLVTCILRQIDKRRLLGVKDLSQRLLPYATTLAA